MNRWWIAPLLACAAHAGAVDWAKLRIESATIARSDPKVRAVRAERFNHRIEDMLRRDELKSADDFAEAALAYMAENSNLRQNQIRHELMLTALVLGSADARREIAGTWDPLIMSTGRNARLGVVALDDKWPKGRFAVVPTAQVVRDALLHPQEAAARARTTRRHPEIAKIMAADQAARNSDWSKLSMEEMLGIAREDEARLARVREIVFAATALHPRDLGDAALVCQHGGLFDDYALAHELCLASLLTGNSEAKWLAAASYDRMLTNSGYAQRFGTQYVNERLAMVDSVGVNDRMRLTIAGFTLREAKAREVLFR